MDRIHNPYHWIITYKYVIWYSVCRCNGVYDGCVRDEDELECTGGSYALLTHTVLYKRWSNLVLFCNFRKATSFCPSSIFSGSQFQRNQRIWPRACASQMRQSFHFQKNLDFGYYPQNYKRQNEKRYKGKPNRVQSALARRIRQSCTGPPLPPSLNSCIGLLQNFVFVILQNFHKIFYFVFAKFFSHLKLFCQNFVFREILTKTFFISRNWRQISQNTK